MDLLWVWKPNKNSSPCGSNPHQEANFSFFLMGNLLNNNKVQDIRNIVGFDGLF